MRLNSLESSQLLLPAVAQALIDHFVGTVGFWKDQRGILMVDMQNFEKAHWELGDLIEPDNSFDAHMKYFGTGWGSILMMIIKKTITPMGLHFEMMKVN